MLKHKNIPIYSTNELTYEEFTDESNIKKRNPCSFLLDDIVISEQAQRHKGSMIEDMIPGQTASKTAKDYICSLGLEDFVIEYSEAKLGQRENHYIIDKITKEFKKEDRALDKGQWELREHSFYFPTAYFVYITFTKNETSIELPIMIGSSNGNIENKYTKQEIISTWELAKQRTIVIIVQDERAEKRLYHHLSNDDGVKEIVSVDDCGIGERLREESTYEIKEDQTKMKKTAAAEYECVVEEIHPIELEKDHD